MNHTLAHRPSALATHRLRKLRSVPTYLYSLEIVYSHLVTVIALRKWHFVVSWRFGQSLHEFDARVWWLALCEFCLTCSISVYYVRNKGFSFNAISVSHFWLCGVCVSFTIQPVHSWCGLWGRCLVYIKNQEWFIKYCSTDAGLQRHSGNVFTTNNITNNHFLLPTKLHSTIFCHFILSLTIWG